MYNKLLSKINTVVPQKKEKEQWEIDIEQDLANLPDEEDDIVPKDNNEIKYFPLKEVSINQFRKEEQKYHKQKFGYSTYKSFHELFTKRITGKKNQKVSIKIEANINKGDDETRILKKGPYEVNMPFDISIDDKYKFAVNVLLDNSFLFNREKS